MKLNSLFQNGAVFQREKNIPVWGKTLPNHHLTAQFGGTKSATVSNDQGDFRLFLPPFKAGGPHTLTVTDTDSNESIEVHDILVGEVWLASGQSNMSYLLESDWALDTTIPKEQKLSCKQRMEFCKEISNPSQCRFFMVKQAATANLESEAVGQWQRMDSEHAPKCSAVAAWFGRFVQEALGIPVGMLVTAWGGTIAEAWTSTEGLLTNPDTADSVFKLQKRMREDEAWKNGSKDAAIARLSRPDPGNEGVKKGWASPAFDDNDWSPLEIPGSWKQQGIAGNGAVWVRRRVVIPKEWEGKAITLCTGGIDKHDVTYFNGVEIGRTGKELESEWFNAARNYSIPANLATAGENTVAIRAFSFLWEGAFWGRGEAYCLRLDGTDETIPLGGTWRAKAEFDWGNLAMDKLSSEGYGVGNPNTPAILFGSMLHPLIPYAVRGAIWYQGESNAHSIGESRRYLNILATMLKDWRFRFGQGDFPFIQVQLANWRAPADYDQASTWAPLRESQRLLCKRLPNVYMASAIDLGEEEDIHPQDKKSVGRRLADCALANVSGLAITPSGPLYRAFRCELNRIRLFFDYADGLWLKGGAANSNYGFFIIGANGEAYPADSVTIKGNTVVVASSKCQEPFGVKYAWADNPPATLFNAANLPASSFSTLD